CTTGGVAASLDYW
nr:immunoglobulin heavy chain junction region [Macaca mulatta]